ncbi:MAG: hypothetical protein ACO1RX_22220 [Candidatus Sericytochromatia bacterium]
MLDCLPTPNDWSPATQYLLLREHLAAMRSHLDSLQGAADAAQLVQAAPELNELNARCLEAHTLLQSLATLSPERLQAL